MRGKINNHLKMIANTWKRRFKKLSSGLSEAMKNNRVVNAIKNNRVVFKVSMPKKMVSIASMALVAVLVPTIAISANKNMAEQPVVDETLDNKVQVNRVSQETPAIDLEELEKAAETESAITESSTSSSDTSQTETTGEVTPDAAANEQEPEQEQEEPESQYMALEPYTNHEDVIALQQRLIDLNYMDNDEPTDYYGPGTQQAVKYFQRKNGLEMDGVCGVNTQELLFSDEAKPYSVALEASGEDVWSIQERLNELGYWVEVTGYFGTETEKQVKYFQRMNNLWDDGSVGNDTKEVLYSGGAYVSEELEEKRSQEESEGESTDGGESSGGSESSSDSGGSESSSSGSSESSSDSGGSSSSDGDSKKEESKQEEPKQEAAPAPEANPGNVEAFIDAAMAQVGKRYVLGGKGPDTFDCSGFVYYALKQSGNGIGYMTSGGWASSGYTTIGSVDDLQRGDIICIRGHVGIYLGGGSMVDASSSLGKIVVRNVGSWARSNFICGKRPL